MKALVVFCVGLMAGVTQVQAMDLKCSGSAREQNIVIRNAGLQSQAVIVQGLYRKEFSAVASNQNACLGKQFDFACFEAGQLMINIPHSAFSTGKTGSTVQVWINSNTDERQENDGKGDLVTCVQL